MKQLLLLLVVLCGCVPDEPRYIALPEPPPVAPTIQLPVELRHRNWTTEGSCVYASFCSAMECYNRHDLATFVRQNYAGPATAQHIIGVCKRLGVEYDTTYQADPGFLDWADRNGYPVVIWWKSRHCCTFINWVRRQDGRVYAAILDNNRPERIEYTERQEFLQRWAVQYGGFGLAPMCDLATVVPFNAYELAL